MSDDFGKRIESFGQNIWKKAQSAVDTVTINSDIAAKTRELTQLYADIGREYCVSHGLDAEREMPELFEKASALAKEIADMQETLNLKKGFRKCLACGALVPVQAAFCPSCGAAMPPMPEPEPEPEPEKPDDDVCPACGRELDDDDKFCPACGAKRAEQAEQKED